MDSWINPLSWIEPDGLPGPEGPAGQMGRRAGLNPDAASPKSAVGYAWILQPD
ncbi:hypothetical protein HQN87_17370 [Paenibacillus tritici]|uniref:Collagen-like protein n=1 Tax=Paenibacillus tritici TaxID=1873425 RepID=A0ABX2DST6_9BACL|nr:hypothetical protein [Paenibacillus tritici]NQX47103.1 hypothetical protein [Paenibacillus tritici]QUL54636.1 hypothetical protein KDC22_31000 [Paenibacillus tritici]